MAKRREGTGVSESDKALALMVYETWLLNGATEECMPSLKLRKWCNRTLKRHLFPLPSASVENFGKA